MLVVPHAHLEGFKMLAGELEAAVYDDNSVITLTLMTEAGLFVRFGADWQLLSPESALLDGTGVYSVDPSSVGIFDLADASGQTISILDLPVSAVPVHYVEDADELTEAPEPLSSPVISAIDSASDLRTVMQTRDAAWYADKRRMAFAPRHESTVVASCREYLALLLDGQDPDPSGVFRRDLIKRARQDGMLSHPIVSLAVAPRSQHRAVDI